MDRFILSTKPANLARLDVLLWMGWLRNPVIMILFGFQQFQHVSSILFVVIGFRWPIHSDVGGKCGWLLKATLNPVESSDAFQELRSLIRR
jgi:hypothetical protein